MIFLNIKYKAQIFMLRFSLRKVLRLCRDSLILGKVLFSKMRIFDSVSVTF